MNLELMKADIEAIAAKVLTRPTKVEQGEITDQDGEPVEGLTVDGFLLVYPVKMSKVTISGKVVEIEDVAIDVLVGGDGQFEEPDPMRHPFEGHAYQTESRAIAEVIALLAKADAEGHLEALGEERYLAERDEAAKALDKPVIVPLRVSKDRCIQAIEVMQPATCNHCKGPLLKGSEARWLRSDEENGGLYHTDCLEVVGEPEPKFDGACPDECADFDLCPECNRLKEGHVQQIPAEIRIMKIVIQQDTPCVKCGEMVEKGKPGKWVRASSAHTYGGIYHSYCCKAV